MAIAATNTDYQKEFADQKEVRSFPPILDVHALAHSSAVTQLQKKYISQVVESVHKYGMDNLLELFNACGYCFDFDFFSGATRSMITINEYLALMGEEVQPTLQKISCINADYFAHNRPGFFILTPQKEAFFLKEAENESLVVYDPSQDQFVDASSFPISGNERLVILNKNQFPEPETYFATSTPDSAIDGKFYHENQTNQVLCAVHAAHAFVGFPFVNQTELSLLNLENTLKLQINLSDRQYSNSEIEEMRFDLAMKTDVFQADMGNSPENIKDLLVYTSSKGLIDAKYMHVQVRSISYSELLRGFAWNHGIYFNENTIEDFFIRINKQIDQMFPDLEAIFWDLKEKLIQLVKSKKDKIGNEFTPEYAQLQDQIFYYADYHNIKGLADDALACLQALKKAEESQDRVMIFDSHFLHTTTVRRDENGQWTHIDSLAEEQKIIPSLMSLIVQHFKAYNGIALNFIFLGP